MSFIKPYFQENVKPLFKRDAAGNFKRILRDFSTLQTVSEWRRPTELKLPQSGFFCIFKGFHKKFYTISVYFHTF